MHRAQAEHWSPGHGCVYLASSSPIFRGAKSFDGDDVAGGFLKTDRRSNGKVLGGEIVPFIQLDPMGYHTPDSAWIMTVDKVGMSSEVMGFGTANIMLG